MTKYVNEQRCVVVEAHGAKALVDTTGSQLVSWITPEFGEQMYISALCGSPPDMSIRAGNPICWPQFCDEGPLTKHGIVRMLPWEVVSNQDGKAQLKICLKDHENGGLKFSFTAVFTVELTGPNTLTADLTVTNDSTEPITNQTVAFHPYFAVGDIGKVTLEGFKGHQGFDKTCMRENQIWIEDMDSVPVPDGKPIDTKYSHQGAPIPFTVLNRGSEDPKGNLKAEFLSGFEDAVVWNVGSKDVVDLKDVPDPDWEKYICMEQAQLTPNELAAGATSSWAVRYSVSK